LRRIATARRSIAAMTAPASATDTHCDKDLDD
jgi:hypothetical protein